jgi:hypothetical protein
MWLAVAGGGLGSLCSVLRVLIAGENNNNMVSLCISIVDVWGAWDGKLN